MAADEPSLMSDACDELERHIATLTDPGARASLSLFLKHMRAENAMDPEATMATMTKTGSSRNYGIMNGPRDMPNKDRLAMYQFAFDTCPESWVYQNIDGAHFVANDKYVIQEGFMRVVVKGERLGIWGGKLPEGGDPNAYYELGFSNVISMRIVDGLIDNEDIWNDGETTARPVKVDEERIARAIAARKKR